jgi:hypothetical protein
MMFNKRLALPAFIVLALLVALIATDGAAAKENVRAARARASERMANMRISGLSDVTIECGQSTEPANTGYPRVTGDYPPFELTYADLVSPGNSAGSYTITRVWTIADAYGNEKMDTQTISVTDTQPPEIACPDDVTFECDALGDFGVATAEDNSKVDPVITYQDTIIWQRCEHEYIKIRTWTATDQCGNSASCEQTININDSTAPVIICPNDTTISCEELGQLAHAIATDNCVEDLHMDYEPVRVDDPDKYNILIRTWEVTDGCCNKVGCYQRVTLIDSIPPEIECAPDDTISCEEIPVFIDPVATDNCEPRCTVEVLSSSHGSDPSSGVETFTQCWKAYDNLGNESETCCQTIVRLPCEDETCTFTQGGWGNGCPKPQQGNPESTQSGCIRDYYFGAVFGQGGVTIGIPAGATHGATWTTPEAIEDFLPAGGTPAPLAGDLSDPTSTPAGILAGQILALRLNREYSCAGIFNIALNPDAGCLGSMMIPESCQGKFGAMTVDAFLVIADQAIAGVTGVLDPYGASFSDLNDAATCINEYYDNCAEEDDREAAEEVETIAPLAGTPTEFGIKAVKPNPLETSTTIHYALPAQGRVSLEVFDIHGRKVTSLVDEHKSAGYHGVIWDGRDGAGDRAAQGVYFLRMTFEDRPAVMHKLVKVE